MAEFGKEFLPIASSQPTYEGLKLFAKARPWGKPQGRSQPTYEGLKPAVK